MKLLTTAIFLIYTTLTFAQEDSKKIFFSTFLQTGYSYRTINNDYYHENPAGTFGGGLSVSYKLNKLKIESGIQYQQYALVSKFDGVTFGDQIDRQTGFVNTNNQDFNAVSFKYLHQYISIPLGINYNIIQFGAKNSIHVSAGIASNFYVNSKVIQKKYKGNKSIERKSENYIFDARKICLSSYYAVTYERSIKNIAFFVGPKFDLFHNPTTNSTSVKRTPYKVSLFVGVDF